MSAKGLEWARQLRLEIVGRIDGLREALAGIEPLRQELARLEEQLKGVDRLIAAYEDQLGYPKAGEALQPASAFAVISEEASPAAAPPRTMVTLARGEPDSLAVACREFAAALRRAAVRAWMLVQSRVAEIFPRRNAQS